MTHKYVRLSPGENNYGKKNLLQSQLALLTAIKHFNSYKLLRKEELIFKIQLKNKVAEVLETLSYVDKTIPKIHFESEHPMDAEERIKVLETRSLEEELEEIKRKLATLQ